MKIAALMLNVWVCWAVGAWPSFKNAKTSPLKTKQQKASSLKVIKHNKVEQNKLECLPAYVSGIIFANKSGRKGI